MSLEHFQLLDNEPIDNTIIKRDYLKIYHQRGPNLNDSNQNVAFIFGENNNYHQIGKDCLEFVITVRNPAANFDKTSDIRLNNNALAFCFKEASLATTSGSELEYKKYLSQVSTIMRSITSKDGDLLSHFDKFNDADTVESIKDTSSKKCSLMITLW